MPVKKVMVVTATCDWCKDEIDISSTKRIPYIEYNYFGVAYHVWCFNSMSATDFAFNALRGEDIHVANTVTGVVEFRQDRHLVRRVMDIPEEEWTSQVDS